MQMRKAMLHQALQYTQERLVIFQKLKKIIV